MDNKTKPEVFLLALKETNPIPTRELLYRVPDSVTPIKPLKRDKGQHKIGLFTTDDDRIDFAIERNNFIWTKPIAAMWNINLEHYTVLGLDDKK